MEYETNAESMILKLLKDLEEVKGDNEKLKMYMELKLLVQAWAIAYCISEINRLYDELEYDEYDKRDAREEYSRVMSAVEKHISSDIESFKGLYFKRG